MRSRSRRCWLSFRAVRVPSRDRRACVGRSRHMRGLSLLEVTLAIAILGGCIAVIGELVRLGTRQAEETRELTTAQLLCESKLEEIAAGAVAPETVSSAPFENDPRWTYTVDVSTLDVENLLQVTCTVQQVDGARVYPLSYMLTRWIIDPEVEAALIEMSNQMKAEAEAEAQAGSESGSGQTTGSEMGSGQSQEPGADSGSGGGGGGGGSAIGGGGGGGTNVGGGGGRGGGDAGGRGPGGRGGGDAGGRGQGGRGGEDGRGAGRGGDAGRRGPGSGPGGPGSGGGPGGAGPGRGV